MEEAVRDPVPRLHCRCGGGGVLLSDIVVVVIELVVHEVGVEPLAGPLAEVVQHAAGGDHAGEVLHLHLGAALQAAPPRLEPPDGVPGHAARGGDPLVERVLRPRQVPVRVRHEHAVRERPPPLLAAVPPEQPGGLAQRRPAEHRGIRQRARVDPDVRERPVGVHDGLDGDGVGGLVVPLREAAVVVRGDVGLRRDDGDARGVDGADDARDPRGGLEPGRDSRGGGGVRRPADGRGPEHGGQGAVEMPRPKRRETSRRGSAVARRQTQTATRRRAGMAARSAVSSLATAPPSASQSAPKVARDMRKARRNSASGHDGPLRRSHHSVLRSRTHTRRLARSWVACWLLLPSDGSVVGCRRRLLAGGREVLPSAAPPSAADAAAAAAAGAAAAWNP
ncbi:hypothetical protein U9M48_042409 [Paspalum notatum var. saurae]|uniref:Uncharacterized protein n=1 Tax=Paspalum notatum var. saurae TaxID=547442 RepID=A0AAQ3XG53_PASNO